MLGRTNAGGGGSGGLNFQVIGGTTAPSNPKENMIWVNTSTKITSYIFSATQPTGSAGMVWITIGSSSSVSFNALKKNSVMVYPISAKQYISGAWVDKTAKSYQGGEWKPWITDILLFDSNDKNTRVWTHHQMGGSKPGSLTYTDQGMVLTNSATSAWTGGWCMASYEENSLDFSKFNTITANVVCNTEISGSTVAIGTGVYNQNEFTWIVKNEKQTVVGMMEISVDISSVDEGYVTIALLDVDGGIHDKTTSIVVKDLKLEV